MNDSALVKKINNKMLGIKCLDNNVKKVKFFILNNLESCTAM